MQIYGFQKTTLLDYPGHIAATVFTGGCNFRCPFCHNAGLVVGYGNEKEQKSITSGGNLEVKASAPFRIEEAEVLAYLQKRRGILQGVCITGGEPTLQPDLEDFIRKLKDLGYLVKLDTNGYRPEVLEKLLNLQMLDYAAMDVKACKENYGRAAGVTNLDLTRIEKSVELLKNSAIPYEFRTTVVRGIHTIAEFEAIGKWIAGCKAYYLQAFRENENLLGSRWAEEQRLEDDKGGASDVKNAPRMTMRSFSREEMEQMAELARKYIDKVILRGVE